MSINWAPFLIPLIPFCLIGIPITIILKPWKQPKVGEIWEWTETDPFDPKIRYEITDRKEGWVRLKMVSPHPIYPRGYITTKSLLYFRDHAVLKRKAIPDPGAMAHE